MPVTTPGLCRSTGGDIRSPLYCSAREGDDGRLVRSSGGFPKRRHRIPNVVLWSWSCTLRRRTAWPAHRSGRPSNSPGDFGGCARSTNVSTDHVPVRLSEPVMCFSFSDDASSRGRDHSLTRLSLSLSLSRSNEIQFVVMWRLSDASALHLPAVVQLRAARVKCFTTCFSSNPAALFCEQFYERFADTPRLWRPRGASWSQLARLRASRYDSWHALAY